MLNFLQNLVNIAHVNLPPICANEPAPGDQFCHSHLKLAKDYGLQAGEKFPVDTTSELPDNSFFTRNG